MVIRSTLYRINNGDPYIHKYILYEYDSNDDLIITDEDFDYIGTFFPPDTHTHKIHYADENNTFIVSYINYIDDIQCFDRIVFDTTTKTTTTIDSVATLAVSSQYPIKVFDGGNKIYSCVTIKLYKFENGQYTEYGMNNSFLNYMCESSVVISSGIWVGVPSRKLSSDAGSGYLFFYPNDGNGFFSTTVAYTITPHYSSVSNLRMSYVCRMS